MYSYFFLVTLVFLVLLLFWGFYRFQNAISEERDELFRQYPKEEARITASDIAHLPKLLQNYFKKVGVVGNFKYSRVIIKQQGKIKTGLDKKWMNFRALQYMTGSAPNFIWSAQTYPLFIRDKSIGGKGEVKVNLLGLKDVAVYQDTKTDKSALSRCLGELVLFPIGLLSKDITWEIIDEKKLRAKVQNGDTQAEGIFVFNPDGLISRFQARRYRGTSLEEFSGIFENYQPMQHLLIPKTIRAIWHLVDGDFEYFKASIVGYDLK